MAQLSISGIMGNSSGTMSSGADVSILTVTIPNTTVQLGIFGSMSLDYTKNSDGTYTIKNLVISLRRTNVGSFIDKYSYAAIAAQGNSSKLTFTGFKSSDRSSWSMGVRDLKTFSTSLTSAVKFCVAGAEIDAVNQTAYPVLRGSSSIAVAVSWSYLNSYGRTVTESKTENITISVNLTAPKTGVKYTFLGNGGTIAGESTVVKHGTSSIHIPVAARGKSNSKGSGSYKVTFDPKNGSSSSTVNCPYTTTITWISKKYSRVDNSSITVEAETSYKVPDTNDRTWNAVWQVGSETADGPAKLTLPNNPTWFGHTFDGWYKDGTAKVKSGDKVKGPFTAVAHWIKQTYNITFNLNNNYSPKWISGATMPIKKTYSDSINLSDQFPNEPVAFGFKFIGWGTKDKVIYSGYNTQIGDKIVNDQKKISDIVLYAHWEPLNDNIITYSYNLNNSLIKNTYHYNILTTDSTGKSRFVVPEPADRGVDWVFLGWYMPKNYKDVQKPWTSKPESINNEVFWGNTTVATSMGNVDFAYGIFRNPDDIDDKTIGTTLSPIEIVPFSSGGGDKSESYNNWQRLSGQTDNVEYNNINSKAWNWTWEFYGFWTITGKYIATSKDKDGNIIWSKVKAAYVLVPKTGALSDKDLEWKYVKEVYTCVRMNGLTPIWKREVWN